MKEVTNKLKLKTPEKKALSVEGFFSLFLYSSVHVHIMHLQSESYSEHIALGNYYESISDIIDGFIESYQGKYGLITSYPAVSYPNSTVLDYFSFLQDQADLATNLFTDSDLLNTLDEVKTLIKSTMYKLQFLK